MKEVNIDTNIDSISKAVKEDNYEIYPTAENRITINPDIENYKHAMKLNIK